MEQKITFIQPKLRRIAVLVFGGALIVIASFLQACGDPNYQPEPDPSTIKVIKAESTIKGE